MERLRRRKHQIVGTYPQHLSAIRIRRRLQTSMHMPHALRRAGRPRRIQPERHLIRRRHRGRRIRRTARQKRRKPHLPRIIDRRRRRPIRLRNHNPPQTRHAVQHRQQRPSQRRRDHHRVGPAVRQDITDHFRRQQRIDRHRNNAGTQRTPERHREIDRVKQQQRNPPLPPHPSLAQCPGKPVRRRRQPGIAQTAPWIAKRDDLARAPRAGGDRRSSPPRCRCSARSCPDPGSSAPRGTIGGLPPARTQRPKLRLSRLFTRETAPCGCSAAPARRAG